MLLVGSCNKKIMDYPDPNSKSIESYFNTPEEIQQGAVAIYSSFFSNSAFTWRLPEMFDGLANEFDGRPSSTGETYIQLLWRYQHNNSSEPIWQFWRLLYRMILRSNLVIFKGDQYTAAHGNDEMVSHALGDAYFLRGWANSQLAFHWEVCH